MQITADLHLLSIENTILQHDDDNDEKSLSMFTDGLIPCLFEQSITKTINYEYLLDRIKLNMKPNESVSIIMSQIDGIVDDDDDKDTKPIMKKREFFVHSTNNLNYSSVS